MDNVGIYEFDRRKEVGRGGFGTVYEGNELQNKTKKVAVKVIKMRGNTNIQRELKMLKEVSDLNHENFVHMLHGSRRNDEVILVMELCNQDLGAYLRKLKSLPETTIASFTRQIVRGLHALNHHNIIHRDLKPQNLLLSYRDKNPHPNDIIVKIADFGLARFLPTGAHQQLTQCGTIVYMAPEALLSGNYDSKADIWSIGLIIHEMLTGGHPFSGHQLLLQIDRLGGINAMKQYRSPGNASSQLRDVLNRTIKVNPADRIDIHSLARHLFLKVSTPGEKPPELKRVLTPREKLTELKKKYLPEQMPREEKRKLYSCASKLTDIPTWKNSRPVTPSNVNPLYLKDGNLNSKVSIWSGDITKLEVDAIVNPSNTELQKGIKVGANMMIHEAAGRLLELETKLLIGRCDTGSAVLTAGYKSPAYYIIHTVGPNDNDGRVLARCYQSCLQRVRDHNIRSVAFPPIGTGNFGYPVVEATRIALQTVREWLETGRNSDQVDRVVFVCFKPDSLEAYNKYMPVYFPK